MAIPSKEAIKARHLTSAANTPASRSTGRTGQYHPRSLAAAVRPSSIAGPCTSSGVSSEVPTRRGSAVCLHIIKKHVEKSTAILQATCIVLQYYTSMSQKHGLICHINISNPKATDSSNTRALQAITSPKTCCKTPANSIATPQSREIHSSGKKEP